MGHGVENRGYKHLMVFNAIVISKKDDIGMFIK
jgi:hypothetical protein